MPELPPSQLKISRAARRDIAAITAYSLKHFGAAAARRYFALIEQALDDIALNPARPGSRARPDLSLDTTRTYHLSFSRDRVAGEEQVSEPRHLIVYRILQDGVVQVARVLHERRDLPRHIRML